MLGPVRPERAASLADAWSSRAGAAAVAVGLALAGGAAAGDAPGCGGAAVLGATAVAPLAVELGGAAVAIGAEGAGCAAIRVAAIGSKTSPNTIQRRSRRRLMPSPSTQVDCWPAFYELRDSAARAAERRGARRCG